MLRRGEFTSRADLIDKITDFAIRYNRTAKPWTWAYDARATRARIAAHPRITVTYTPKHASWLDMASNLATAA